MSTTKKIRWGILGCGRIAGKFAQDLQLVADAELCAVASRDQSRADAFGAQYQARFLHGDYESMMINPEVDVIYIATPHAQHAEYTLQCLAYGKAVLCEKAFALNSSQVRKMVDASRSSGVFLMEALWTKFMPHYRKLMALIDNGSLGTMRSVLINFGFTPPDPIPDRMFNPGLGGGSLLDIGIYNVFMAMSALGVPDNIEAWMTPAASGVDEQCAVTFRYKQGAIAQLFSSFSSNLATEADFSGTRARVRLTHRFYEPSTNLEFYPGRVDSRTVIPVEKLPGWGYHYEIRHVQECLRQGLTESPVMRLDDSILLMEVLDEIRRKAGIRYPADE